ncbi:prolyl 4-hydroxylase subunit alpha-1-like [Pseudorca crassidens]|uniref:prolyl 4-hydroxylase subunit alpha-1-like n=1 Tax=Pseudorca crassidens TaxID=82174 RepID=UPI00352C9644
MKRSRVFSITSPSVQSSKARVSQSVFLTEEEDPVIGQVNRRIQLITGLSDETAEFFQVADYGIGGYYDPHMDYFLEVRSCSRWGGCQLRCLMANMLELQWASLSGCQPGLWPKC